MREARWTMKKIAYFGRFTESMLRALAEKIPDGYESFSVDPDAPISELADADHIICRAAKLPKESIEALSPKTRLIHRWGVGYDSVDIEAAGKRGIPVAICVGGNSLPVAEMTVTLMLAVYRNVIPLREGLLRGEVLRERYSPRSYLISGKTVGLLGMGNIAKKVGHIVKNGFGADVIYYDVYRLREEDEASLGFAFVSLDELARKSDILSVHVPLLESTAGMVNASMISKMKKTAIIVNTARGGVVNEDDLTAALQDGRILGAGLDTFSQEPLPADSPLLRLDSVVTTPHCAGNTVDNDINMAAICMETIKTYDTTGDKTLRAFVNREFLS